MKEPLIFHKVKEVSKRAGKIISLENLDSKKKDNHLKDTNLNRKVNHKAKMVDKVSKLLN
jgi:hypothetical protein